MKVCFFGASVSEQNRHHTTKEITGYVTYLSEVLASQYNWDISKVTSGSNTIDDAGVVYVHRVIELKPDVCVLDWATPAGDSCDLKSIEFIYSELLSNKIIPLTVIFPRTDRDQSLTPMSLMLQNFCNIYSLPFVDLSKLIDKSELNSILRDTVHTNIEGAKKYADILMKEIEICKVSTNIFAEFTSKPKYFIVKKVKPNGKVKNKTEEVNINISTSFESKGKVKFFLEQRVGPWSTFIDVYAVEPDKDDKYLQTIPIYDAWCWRERQCLKEITDWIDLPIKTIKLCQSDKLPNYGQNVEKCDFENQHKHIRPKGDLFMLSTNEQIESNIVYHT